MIKFDKSKIIQGIGIFLNLILLILCYYLTIVGAAFLGLEKANAWAGQYSFSFLTDFSFTQPISVAFKLAAINSMIKGRMKKIHKLVLKCIK